ncbi:MAG: MATE family efflux transporter [Oscillospiraceae bacterium]|nr:MATE family efflux transporter [Oscillospiraceae bacterium]
MDIKLVLYMYHFILSFFHPNKLLKNIPACGEIPDAGTLLRRTLKVAWPSTLESFLVALVSVVDTIMVGRLGSSAIASIGLTGQPKFIFLAIFISLNVAVSALVARRKGENDRSSANSILIQALAITGILTIIVTALALFFADPILRLAGTNADTHDGSILYFRIIMGGLVFNVFSMVINAAQRGVGNTKIALKTNLISNGVNIVFNYLLIGGNLGFPRLGIAGAAIATVLGSFVALILSARSIMDSTGFIYLRYHEKRFSFDKATLSGIVNIGSSTLAEQIFLRIGFLAYAVIVAHLGTTAFAAHQIGMNVITISFSFADGLSIAAVALVGQSLGAKRVDLAKIYGSICQRLGFCCSAILSVFYIFGGKEVFMLFSSEPEILDYGVIIMRLTALIVFLQIAQVIFSGCLRGAGDTRYVAMVSLISVTLVRPLCGYLFVYPLQMGLIGAWIGLVIDQCVRLLLSSARFASGKWCNIKV